MLAWIKGNNMKRIACLSQKGGVGKSSIARQLAASFAEAGWDAVIVDMDTRQVTSTKWIERRKTLGMSEIRAVRVRSPKEALAVTDCDIALIDGKPYSDLDALHLAQAVDLVLLPTATSLDDLDPQIVLAHDMVRNGVPKERIVFVIYGFLTSGSTGGVEVEGARSYIERAGYKVAENAIGSRMSYINALNSGLALSEVSHKGCARAANNFAVEISQSVA